MRFRDYLTEKVKFKHGYRVPSKAMKKKFKADPQIELDYWTKELADLQKFKSKLGKGEPGGKAQAAVGISTLRVNIKNAQARVSAEAKKSGYVLHRAPKERGRSSDDAG